MGEGDGIVEIEGFDRREIDMGTDMMILKPDDLKTGEEDITRSFSNPMFNVEPPSNIYSEEPTEDMTFGVDNPTYVALNEMKVEVQDEKEGHYEIIGNIDDEHAEKCGENPKELTGTTLESKIEELISNTTSVEETSVTNVTNDLLNIAETIITKGEKVGDENVEKIENVDLS